MKRLILYITFSLFFNFQTFSQNWLWAKSSIAGGTGTVITSSVCSDLGGNVFVTGRFNSPTITFGSTTLTNSGNADIFLAKYDSNGNLLWAKSVGGANFENAFSVSTDASGNVFITGEFQNTITFGSTILTSAGSKDAFVAKYDTNGNLLWAKNVGGTGIDFGTALHTDANGNVFITGSFSSSTLVFGSITLNNSGGASAFDIFLAKYDANGNALWAKNATGTGGTGFVVGNQVNSISTDTSGNVFITGTFYNSTITFGSITLTNTNATSAIGDIFLAKYDANGNILWAKNPTGADHDEGLAVSADAGGNVFVTGAFLSSSLTFASITLSNTGINNVFLTKYDANGNVLWVKSATGTNSAVGQSLSADASGNVFVVGAFASSITFESTTLTQPQGSSSMFIVKYDSVGNVLCASSLHNNGINSSSRVTTDPLGNAYIGSTYTVNPFIVGSHTLTLTGSSDVFVAKYTCCTIPVAITGTSTICQENSVTLNASGGTSYSWNTGTTGSTLSVTPSSTSTYSVTATDNIGCNGTATYTVTVLPKPTATISGTNSICTGQSTALTSNGGDTYFWSTGESTVSVNVTPAIGNTTYSVIATSTNGCTDTATRTVTVNQYPVASILGGVSDTTICSGKNIALNASGNGTYTWNTNENTSFINASPISSTTYSVVVDNNGCKDTASVNIIVKPSPTANAGEDIALSCGSSAQLNATGIGTYSWIPTEGLSCSNCPNPIVTPSTTIQYCATITSLNGCSNTDCMIVKTDVEFTIPNAFSPNNDGHNDLFLIRGWDNCIKEFSFVIYDRWGEKVFETNNLNMGWDGTYNGKLMDSAVFVYYVTATLNNGEKITKKGNISFIR